MFKILSSVPGALPLLFYEWNLSHIAILLQEQVLYMYFLSYLAPGNVCAKVCAECAHVLNTTTNSLSE